jgi:hypothetical protein
MPWRIERKHPKCKSGYAVVKNTGEYLACHDTRDSALKQLRVLYAKEEQNK